MFERKLPEAYRSRTASLEAWTRAGYAKKHVEDVLFELALAFGWKQEEALRLRPEDKLWEIYRSYYPKKGWLAGWPDQMELEGLVRGLKDLIDEREPELQFPEDLNIGTLVRLAAERPARECGCGCHTGVVMTHIANCCLACPSCDIIVGRGRQHSCRYGGGEVWTQTTRGPEDEGASMRAK